MARNAPADHLVRKHVSAPAKKLLYPERTLNNVESYRIENAGTQNCGDAKPVPVD